MLEGIADLPLHEGRVPAWMLRYMERMASSIVEIIVEEYGAEGLVERLADPLWFQALNNVIGMDWDSSGSTTVTTGILREVTWRNPRLGVLVFGGKGRRARRIPEELRGGAKRLGLGERQVESLEAFSRLAAKVDSALLQAGYVIYHQALIVSEKGEWSIIQQGMNIRRRMARRYHWFNPRILVEEPHKGILGTRHREALNLIARESREARRALLDAGLEKPSTIKKILVDARRSVKGYRSLEEWLGEPTHGIQGVPRIYRPIPDPIMIGKIVARLRELRPSTVEEMLLVRGLGPAAIRALALIADLIYGAKPSTRDPVDGPLDPLTYAYAVGGKDGVPYPYSRRTAEKVIATLEELLAKARMGEKDRLRALRRLARITRGQAYSRA